MAFENRSRQYQNGTSCIADKESNLKNVILSQNGILRSTAIGLAVTNYEANSFYFPRDEHRCELNFTAEETKDKIMVNR